MLSKSKAKSLQNKAMALWYQPPSTLNRISPTLKLNLLCCTCSYNLSISNSRPTHIPKLEPETIFASKPSFLPPWPTLASSLTYPFTTARSPSRKYMAMPQEKSTAILSPIAPESPRSRL